MPAGESMILVLTALSRFFFFFFFFFICEVKEIEKTLRNITKFLFH